jgi:predicted transcriptional regulator of viral defense system
MNLANLIKIIGDLPVFESSLLLAGAVRPPELARQLSRWQQSGRIIQLRRGLYALAPPLQKVVPHPFLIANHMAPGSYVSCQSALSHFGIIPEYSPVTVSVGPIRPLRRQTPLGAFAFHHFKSALTFGYQKLKLAQGQEAFVALPEKALLDLLYLTSKGDSEPFIRELRLNLDGAIESSRLLQFAARAQSPKLMRAAEIISELLREQEGAFKEI